MGQICHRAEGDNVGGSESNALPFVHRSGFDDASMSSSISGLLARLPSSFSWASVTSERFDLSQ
jgi:hypothetical protein